MKLITDIQLREINETLQDLTNVAKSVTEDVTSFTIQAAHEAIARAKNLTLVHNIDALPPAAKNPMWYSMVQLKTNLTAVQETLISGTVAHRTLTQSLQILEDWFRVAVPPTEPIQRFARFDRANQTPVMKIDGLSDEEVLSFQEAFKKPVKPIATDDIKGAKEIKDIHDAFMYAALNRVGGETPAAKNPILTEEQLKDLEAKSDKIEKAVNKLNKELFIPAINNIIPCMSAVLHYFKKANFLLEYEGQPVADNLLVIRFKWWHSRYRIKVLRNALQVKGYPNTFVDNHLIIEAWTKI